MKRLVTMVLSLMLGASLFADNELVVGDINMSATVDQIGGASITIPIEVPAGVNGMQPNLALVYNSHSGYGLAGWGWDLAGISSIQRTGKTLYHDSIVEGVKFDETDNFLLDGERLFLQSGTNLKNGAIYRTENENFNQIKLSTEEYQTFLVTDKEGVVSKYYSTESVAIRTFTKWNIVRSEDTNGNYVTYSYHNYGTNRSLINLIEYRQKDDDVEGWQYIYPTYQIYFYYKTVPYKHHYYVGDRVFTQDKVLSRIDVASDYQDLHSYILEYNTADIVPKLTSIKKVAGNGDYYSPTSIVWTSAETSEQVEASLSVNKKSEYLFGDFNGDGKNDIFSFDPLNTNAVIHYNATTDGVLRFTAREYTLPYNFVKLKTGDYNGDGRMDLIGVYSNNSDYRLTYLLSNGTTFTSTTNYSLCPNLVYAVGDFDGDGDDDFINQDDNKLYCYGKTAVGYPEVYLWYDRDGHESFEKRTDNVVLDFNGDGKTDIFCKKTFQDDFSIMEYNAKDMKFETLISDRVLIGLGIEDFKEDRLRFGDFNGDGKTDIVYSLKQDDGTYLAHIYLSDGTSFIYDCQIWVYDYNLRVHDFNGDGLSDIAYFYPGTDGKWHLRTEINTGTSFVRYNKGGLNGISEDPNTSADLHFYDLHGLGYPDLVLMNSNRYICAVQVYNSNPMLVDKVTDGMGNTYDFTYKSIANSNVYTNTRVGGGGVLPLVSPFYVVSDYTAPYTSLSYHYKNGRYHTQGKGFFGFEEVTTTDNLNQTRKKDICYLTTAHLCYYPYSTTTTTLDGDTISYLKYRYTVREMGGKRIFPHHSGYEYTDHLTGIKETLVSLYDNDGNLYSETKTRGDWKEISQYQYVNAACWCPNKVSSSLTYNVYNGSTSPYRRTFYKYDNRGNLTRQTIDTLYTDTYRLVKQFEYDSFGNVTKEIISGSGQTRTKSYTYSYDGRFMLTSTDEYGQLTTYAYDTVTTLVSSITTPAGTTSYAYDAFGRNVQTVYPDSVITTRTLQRANPISGVRYKAIETMTNKPTVTTYYTSDNKPLYSEKTAFGNKLVYTAYSYYPNGAKKMVSEPYFSTGIAAAASQTFTSDNATLYTYDEYQRPLRVASPQGITLYTYNGLATIINAQSMQKTTKLNNSGFTEYEQTGLGPTPLTLSAPPSFEEIYKKVSYTYYPTGQVKTATPDGGSAVTMEYDVQGNRTKLIDPDAGTITNTYNAFGQVLSRSQSVHGSTPVVTTYTYYAGDGRLSKETMAGNVTSTLTYRYNGTFKNKPSRISGSDGSSSYTYDIYGNIKSCSNYYNNESTRLTTFLDKGLATRYYMQSAGFNNTYCTYDSYGNMTTEKFNSTLAWELLEQNARGQVVRERKGGVVTTYTYDNCGRITSIVAPNIVSLHYTYDIHGNVLAKTDAINDQSIEYTYDHLMRLTSWTVNNNDTQSITYDATTGNIISKSDLGASSEFIYDSSSKPHALRGIDNITGEWICPDLSITYTDFSKVKSIQRGSDSYNIMYGVDKQRACTQKTISGATTTRYYMSNHEIVVDSLGNETYIIYLCNGSIAVHDEASGTKTLYHGYYDAQGSLIALTDNSGNVIARYAYDPWGKRVGVANWAYSPTYTSTLNIDRGYTMHEHLDEFDLINMNGRVYDPAVAQFLSPDPYIQDASNWLNYNRYAYCYNNPTRYIDPSGEALWEIAYTFIADLFSTLINGGLNFNKNIRKNAWRRFDPTAPWSKTNKSLQISRGLIKTDTNRNFWGRTWQFISRFTWEGFQTYVGYESAIIRNIFGDVDRVDYYGGATFITNEEGRKEWGFSLGSFVNASIKGTIDRPFNEYIMKDNPMYMHEYGHYVQSQQTGPLYVVPAIASFLGTKWLYYGEAVYLPKGWVSRVNFMWPEVWANRMAKNYFGLYEEVDWESIQWEYPIEYGLYKKLKYKWY